MKKLISSLLLSFVVCVLQAQIKDPVKFKTEFNTLSDTEAEIVFTAAIDKVACVFYRTWRWRTYFCNV